MPKRVRQLQLGILSGLLGCIFFLTPQGWQLEKEKGLDWLFQWRGGVEAPDDAIVVAIDRTSTRQLGLPLSPNFWPWPRNVHADLIDRLAQAGAELIVLDLLFLAPDETPEHDNQLIQAIKNAGNVIVVERLDQLEQEDFPDTETNAFNELQSVTKTAPLLSDIAKAVLARAPFPLPDTQRVNAYWAFKPNIGDAPTLPVVVFQAYMLEAYDDFLALLHQADPSGIDRLPPSRDQIKDIETVIYTLRQLFLNQPQLRRQLAAALRASALDERKKRLIQALINLYAGPDAYYLNFYGPPRSIPTIPAYQVFQSETGQQQTLRNAVAGKVVFVGLSAGTHLETDQVRDAYHMVFTEKEGIRISGVEIAATAFDNILEHKPVRPLPNAGSLGVLFIMGFALGMTLPVLSRRNLIITSTVVTVGYIPLVWLAFKKAGFWLPLITPLFVVIPCAVFGAVILKYLTAKQERDKAKQERDKLLALFGPFSPERIIGDMTRHVDASLVEDRNVFAACLFTDIAGYTPLAEKMDRQELKILLENYFSILYQCVRQNNGIVTERIGDAMLAIWEVTADKETVRKQVCEAGLAIKNKIRQFNQDSSHPALPTRIGIHFGELLISRFTFDTSQNHIYRVIGNLVNTTNRIETINKRLGTTLLVTHEALADTDHFLTRPLGHFVLIGTTTPVQLVELIAHKQAVTQEHVELCELFANALNAYLHQRSDAITQWDAILSRFPHDGPTQFYRDICLIVPPGQWRSVIQMTEKS